jgi:hypothetical protein
MTTMMGAVYYVFFLLIAGLMYDTLSLDSKYFKKAYFEARNYAVQVLPKQEYQLSGQGRPARPTPTRN